MNVALLRKIQKLFREKPSKALMDSYIELKDQYKDKFEPGEEINFCTTHLCVAGTALVLSGKAKLQWTEYYVQFMSAKTGNQICDYFNAARKVLGIGVNQAHHLFYEEEWPAQFQSDKNTTGSRHLAKMMVARIEHFIKTKGRE